MRIVAKFGGSSLANSRQFRKVLSIVKEDPNRSIIVPSAPGKRNAKDHKVTDLLLMCHQLASHRLNFDDIYREIESRYTEIAEGLRLVHTPIADILYEIYEDIRRGASRAYCASRGEYINGILLADALEFPFVDAKDVLFFQDDEKLDEVKTREAIQEKLGNLPHAVVPGFYGSGADGEIACFSRGGSDVSGAILADGLEADLYENWTDVHGFLMADPKIVTNARPIDIITYKELRELSYMGAKVLHEDAIFPVRRLGIPVQMKDTNHPEEPGTCIVPDSDPRMHKGMITGIAGQPDFTVITVEKLRMTEDLSFFRKLMSIFETNDVPIAHMPSAIDGVSVIVADSHLNGKLKKIMEEIRIYCRPDSVEAEGGMALIAVVGRGMISTKGIAAGVFTALAQDDVNIRMISQGSSEINILVGIENADFQRAIRAIYKRFEGEEHA